jgi:folate-binding protein YgfZ
MPQHSTTVPAALSGDSLAAYQAARRGAAIIERPDRGLIVVSGADRASYLHGLFTNEIAGLKAGEGIYSAYLTPQGRMIADMWVYELGDVVLLAVLREVTATVMAKLDQFIFTEDVQLGDASETFSACAVVGPRAPQVVAQALGLPSPDAIGALREHGNVRLSFDGQPAIVLRTTDTGVDGFDLLVARAQQERLRASLRDAGAAAADHQAAETLRIEAGVPKFHQDMDEDTIPLEAGIERRAISMTKGCYVGQEVIVRVLHRGHGRVARKLVGLTAASSAGLQPGVPVAADEKPIGVVTSVAISPALGRAIALGYVHRDFTAPGTNVSVSGTPAVVAALPFVTPE